MKWIQNALPMALLAAVSLTSAYANPLTLGQAAGYNVFVFNNFTEYNTDAQGTMAVGGNFAPSNGGSFTIAGALSNGAGSYDLVVGGNFTMSGNSMGGGDLYVGGNLNWSDPSLPHNAYVVGSVSNSGGGGSAGGTVYHEGSYSGPSYVSNQHVASGSIPTPINFLSAQTSLDSLSTTLAGETPNGTVTSAYGTYTLTGTSSGINIFNLSDSSYSGATINITAPAGSTVIINVAGSADSFSGGSINLNGVTNNDVIFNFNAATSLTVGSIAFNGTILAPFANVTGNYGQIDGELIALSDAGTTQLNDEVFNGNLGNAPGGSQGSQNVQTTTPEPATWLMLTGGLCAILLAGRKRRLQ